MKTLFILLALVSGLANASQHCRTSCHDYGFGEQCDTYCNEY